jgi:hypothetical protein
VNVPVVFGERSRAFWWVFPWFFGGDRSHSLWEGMGPTVCGVVRCAGGVVRGTGGVVRCTGGVVRRTSGVVLVR